MTDRDVDLIQGTLNVLILKTLSWGPMNGYAIAQWVREATHGDIELEEGALYPALHRMEHRGWLAAEWGVSENNRRAKYYRLTTQGRRALRDQQRHISHIVTCRLGLQLCGLHGQPLCSLAHHAPGFACIFLGHDRSLLLAAPGSVGASALPRHHCTRTCVGWSAASITRGVIPQ